MIDFSVLQIVIILLTFIWSGFVRTALGFGGAALTLPILLIVDNEPLLYLPIISWHLLFFSSLTLRSRLDNVNWPVLKRTVMVMILPKLAGIIGLLQLPNDVLFYIIFGITFFYGLLWLFNITIKSNSKASDIILLSLGGYTSGTSLNGAPLIVSIILRQVEKHQYRETLFVLWIIMVSIKMGAFAIAGVNLQILSAIALLPVVGIGHFIGLKAHDKLVHGNSKTFQRIMGAVLCVICMIGFISL